MPANQKKQTGSSEAFYKKGLIALEGGQYDYAVSLFKDALGIDPNFTKASEGVKAAKTRKLRKSNILVKMIKKTLYALQGAAYKKLKKYDRALDKYENALALSTTPHKLLPPLGDIYYEKEMTVNAAAAYQSFLQKEREDTHCLRKLGKIYMEEGNMAEAKKIYDRLAAAASNDDAVMKEVKDAYALLTIDKGRWEEESSFHKKVKKEKGEGEEEESHAHDEMTAEIKSTLTSRVTALKKQTEKEPDNLNAMKELADSLSRLRRPDEAIPIYKKILKEDPDNLETLRSAGNIYIKSGEYEKAAGILEHLKKLLPENANVLKILAETYLKQDASLKAIEAYLKLAELSPGDADIHETLGKLYEQNRYFEEAIEQYDKVIELNPERTELHQNIGSLYLRDSKHDQAVTRYEKAASASPENISLKKTLADLYLKENRIEDAEKTFRDILKLSPEDSKAKAKLEETEAAARQKKKSGADSKIKKLEEELAKTPDNDKLKTELEAEKKERTELQVEMLVQSIKNEPDNARARFALGEAYMQRGDIDDAIKEFQQTAQTPEKEAESLHMLGLCFEAKNILDIAGRQLEKAESKISEITDLKKAVLYDLGRIYEKTGEKEKALGKYKEIYEVDISYRDVGKKIETVYE